MRSIIRVFTSYSSNLSYFSCQQFYSIIKWLFDHYNSELSFNLRHRPSSVIHEPKNLNLSTYSCFCLSTCMLIFFLAFSVLPNHNFRFLYINSHAIFFGSCIKGIYYVLQALFRTLQYSSFICKSYICQLVAPNFDPSSTSSITFIMIWYIMFDTNKYKYIVRAREVETIQVEIFRKYSVISNRLYTEESHETEIQKQQG